MKTTHRLFACATALVIAASLAACGGGGGDDSTGTGAAPVNNGTADAYVGTWLSDCYETDRAALIAAPGEVLKATSTVTFAKVDNSRLSVTIVWSFYRATGCTGTPVATQTNASPDSSLVIDGTATVAGGAADKVTLTIGAIGGISAGGNIVINGVSYPSDFFTYSRSAKDLFRVSGTSLYSGDLNALDAQGYPTAIDPAAELVKQ